jgi:hypothetical protein
MMHSYPAGVPADWEHHQKRGCHFFTTRLKERINRYEKDLCPLFTSSYDNRHPCSLFNDRREPDHNHDDG